MPSPVAHGRYPDAVYKVVLGIAGWIAIASLAACSPIAGGPADEPRSARSIPARPARTSSLFAYPWVWTDDRGERVSLSRWRGETLVVAAFYASCKSTCPRTIAKLQKIHETFRREGHRAQFLLVTLDPDTDTPEILHRFKESAGFSGDWHLLAGSVPETKELTELLDIHLIDDGPHLMHEAKIVFFDPQGLPVRSFGGWALDDEVRLH
jgi:protein SCO1